tara:strand:- start:250 stop:444 length:195 start_codon:yes stop_codon:yes gene_type:complete
MFNMTQKLFVHRSAEIVSSTIGSWTSKLPLGGAARAFCLGDQGQQIFSITLVFDRSTLFQKAEQ